MSQRPVIGRLTTPPPGWAVEAGVDVISVGALTHSVEVFGLGVDLQ